VDLSHQRPGRKSYPVEHLLQAISAEDRTLLMEHFIQGFTFGELAEKTGRSKEALKKRAQRAIKKIRKAQCARGLPGHAALEALAD
jgi:DNA-directed RNA polymerase specialized sigma24 family protein